MMTYQQISYARTHGTDMPRQEPKKLVEIECSTNTQVVENYVLSRGSNQIEVYESEIPKLSKLVENASDAEWKIANDKLARLLDKWLAGGKTEQTFPHSIQSVFYDLYDRTPLPFTSLKVIDDKAPVAPSKTK